MFAKKSQVRPMDTKAAGPKNEDEAPKERPKLQTQVSKTFRHHSNRAGSVDDIEGSFVWTEHREDDDPDQKQYPQQKCMFSSGTVGNLMWSILIMLALFWVVIMTPFQLAFWNPIFSYDIDPYFWETVELIDLCIDILFWADVVISFRTTYMRADGSMETDPTQVALHYLKTHFTIDLLSCLPGFPLNVIMPAMMGVETTPFPFDPAFLADPEAALAASQGGGEGIFRVGKVSKVMRVVRITKTARLFRCGRLLSKLEERFQCSLWVFRVSLIAIVFFLLSHIVACFYVFFAMWDEYELYSLSWMKNNQLMESDTNSAYSLGFRQYVGALYWAVATLTTVGYGDMLVESTAVRMYSVGMMFLGGIVYAVILSNINSVLESASRSNKVLEDQLDEVRTWVREKKIGKQLSSKIYRYFRYYYRQKSAADEMRILSEISEPLKEELRSHLVGDTLDKLTFFRNLDTNAIMLLLKVLKPLQLLPEEILCHENDEGSEMFFLMEGAVSLSSKDDGGQQRVLRAPCAMGEFAMLGLVTRRAVTITAADHCSLFSLSNADVFRVFENYPDILSDITSRAVIKFKGLFKRMPEHYKSNVDELINTISEMSEKSEGEGETTLARKDSSNFAKLKLSTAAAAAAAADTAAVPGGSTPMAIESPTQLRASAGSADHVVHDVHEESKRPSGKKHLKRNASVVSSKVKKTKKQSPQAKQVESKQRDANFKARTLQPKTKAEFQAEQVRTSIYMDGEDDTEDSVEDISPKPGSPEFLQQVDVTRRHTVAGRVSKLKRFGSMPEEPTTPEILPERQHSSLSAADLSRTAPVGLLNAVKQFSKIHKLSRGGSHRNAGANIFKRSIGRSRSIHNVAKIIGGTPEPTSNSKLSKQVVFRLEKIEASNVALNKRVHKLTADMSSLLATVNTVAKDVQEIRAGMARFLAATSDPQPTTAKKKTVSGPAATNHTSKKRAHGPKSKAASAHAKAEPKSKATSSHAKEDNKKNDDAGAATDRST